MARDNLKVAIGVPGAVCLGDIAEEIFAETGIEVTPITLASSCSHLLSLVSLGQVDAAIGWDVWPRLSKDVEALPIEGARMRHIPAAVIKFSTNQRLAEEFIGFLTSYKGKKIFAKAGYTVE